VPVLATSARRVIGLTNAFFESTRLIPCDWVTPYPVEVDPKAREIWEVDRTILVESWTTRPQISTDNALAVTLRSDGRRFRKRSAGSYSRGSGYHRITTRKSASVYECVRFCRCTVASETSLGRPSLACS